MQVRTDTNIQKLDKFFEISFSHKDLVINDNDKVKKNDANMSLTEEEYGKHHEQFLQDQESFENRCLNKTTVNGLDEGECKTGVYIIFVMLVQCLTVQMSQKLN